MVIANGGYTYDRDLFARAATAVPGAQAAEIEDIDVMASLDAVAPERIDTARRFAVGAAAVLDEVGCDVEVRCFGPEMVPALLLHDEEALERRRLRSNAEASDDLWGAGVLFALMFWLIWRPGGFGPRINEWDRRQVEANGGREVRWEWVVRAAILVPLATIVPLFVLVWMGQR